MLMFEIAGGKQFYVKNQINFGFFCIIFLAYVLIFGNTYYCCRLYGV